MARALTWLITGLVIASVAGWSLIQLLRGGQNASDTASIVSMVLTAAGLAVALAGWETARKTLPQEEDALKFAQSAAETLAKKILDAERKQFRALVGKDEEQFTLTFTRRPRDEFSGTGPARGQVVGSGPATEADLPGIAAYYRACSKPRLVVTGAPGAGKTVLSVQLVRDLIKLRGPDEPVPVRVSLAEWDMKVPFGELLIRHVVRAGTSEERARWMVGHGLVLPVLDGLDEMDPGRTDTDGNPLHGPDGRQLPDSEAPRALAALHLLSNHGGAVSEFPLVLLCRTAHYDALPRLKRLEHAVGVDIDPLDHQHVAAHLTTVFKDEERWQRFARGLSASGGAARDPHDAVVALPRQGRLSPAR
ncbi:hypothetical protein [Streptomyces sp. NPDC018045]|uniref:hypothetical protein n=1 Tax=Streptomyces sp. NPDC018045 TaxID=3365037 RepID=UPI003794493D